MHNLKTPREQIAELLEVLKDAAEKYNALLWSWTSADAAGKAEAWRLLCEKRDLLTNIPLKIERLANEL